MLNILRFTKIYAFISSTLIVLAIFGLIKFGLKNGIDFTGGSLLELTIQSSEPVSLEEVQEVLKEEPEISSIVTSNDAFLIRGTSIDASKNQEIKTKLSDAFGSVTELRFETIGPILGAELVKKTFFAVILGSIAIMLFVAYQFKDLKYGVCAILAMIHDTIVVLGSFAWLGMFLGVEVDSLFVTAILTTLSFSIHDTIVVFDRIREQQAKSKTGHFPSIVNQALLETMGRSLNNSMTIIFMLLALVLLGGESIRWFVVALLIGTVTGTYSSPFVAAPLLVWWHSRQHRA